MTFDVATHSEAGTIALGKALGPVLSDGDVLALRGDLGAGKTHFVQGIAQGMGIDDVVITIDRRGNETESEEHHQSTKDGCHVKQFATKEQGYENEEVLYPVLRTYKS